MVYYVAACTEGCIQFEPNWTNNGANNKDVFEGKVDVKVLEEKGSIFADTRHSFTCRRQLHSYHEFLTRVSIQIKISLGTMQVFVPKFTTSSFAKKNPVDFDGELKIGNVRYDNIT